MSNSRTIKIFDTTLRQEKLEIAQALIELGVNVIEAGFPIASPGDFEAVREIASNFRGAEICGLARSNDRDIDRAWEALKGSADPRIHVFLATSAIHREFKLKMSPDEIISRAVAGVTRAKSYCDNIEFSPEDAARTEPDFLCRVVEAVIAAGATTVNIPDTVGYATPEQMGVCIKNLIDRVPNIDKAIIRNELETVHLKKSSWRSGLGLIFTISTRRSIQNDLSPPADLYRRLPGWRCSAIKRSWAEMRLLTKPEFIKTEC